MGFTALTVIFPGDLRDTRQTGTACGLHTPWQRHDRYSTTTHILKSDNDKYFREILRAVFSRCGFGTLLAADGDETVQIVCRKSIHVVLTVLHVPKLSGLKAILQIKDLWRGVPWDFDFGRTRRHSPRTGKIRVFNAEEASQPARSDSNRV